MILTIIGAGNGGHVLCGLAGAQPNVEVRLMTRRPEMFSEGSVRIESSGESGHTRDIA